METIRKMERLGYDADVFLLAHSTELSKLTEGNDIAKELIFLVLGSNTDDTHLLSTMLSLSEQLISDSRLLLVTNAAIFKYMQTRKENVKR
jgi:hypothetical protein